MFDEGEERADVLDRYRFFLERVDGEPVAAAILSFSMSLKEAAWIANPTDNEGKLSVDLSGTVETSR